MMSSDDADAPDNDAVHTRATQPVAPVERQPAAPETVSSEADTGPSRVLSRRERALDAEMRMLREAYGVQSQMLAALHKMVANLEKRQADGETRLHERLDGIHEDLASIKTALNGAMKGH